MNSCRHYPPPAEANWVNRIGFLPGQSTFHQIQQDRYGTQVKHRFSHPLRTGFLILKRLSWYSIPTAKVHWYIKQNRLPNARFCICCDLWRTNTMSRVLFVWALRSSAILCPVTGWLCPTFPDSAMVPSSRVQYPIKNRTSHSSYVL